MLDPKNINEEQHEYFKSMGKRRGQYDYRDESARLPKCRAGTNLPASGPDTKSIAFNKTAVGFSPRRERNAMKNVNKCCNCKFFEREKISASRSGRCVHDRWKGVYPDGKSCLIGCGTRVCEAFEKSSQRL